MHVIPLAAEKIEKKILNIPDHWGEIADQEFDPESIHAQSGIAVAEALESTLQFVEQELADEQRAQARANIGTTGYDWRAVYYGEAATAPSGYIAKLPPYASQDGGTYAFSDYSVKYDIALAMKDADGSYALCSLATSMQNLVTYSWTINYKNVINNLHSAFQMLSNAGAFTDSTRVCFAFSRSPEIEESVFHLYLRFDSSASTYRLYNLKGARYIEFNASGTVLFNNINPLVDNSLSIANRPADAKAVGDALALKAAATHDHNDVYYTESEIDSKLATKSNTDHKHDDLYDAKGAAAQVKNDLLNGAGAAYDTLKELGDLIDTNVDAIEALNTVAAGKADKEHNHDDRYYTEAEVNALLAGRRLPRRPRSSCPA